MNDTWRSNTALQWAVTEGGKIDPAIVAALYVEHGAELRRFITGVLRDREAAGDVLQAVFVKAVEQGDCVDPEKRKGWLFTVALHEALAQRRRLQTRKNSERELSFRPAKRDLPPDEQLTRVETVAAVRQALAGLPAEQAGVVLARIYEEKSFAQIANESGLPLGTVLTRMRLAVEKLRRALSGQ